MTSPLYYAAAITVISTGLLLLSRLARGWRRLISQRLGLYLGLPGVTAVLVLLPVELNLTFSDGLSLAGLVLSLGFGLGARAVERLLVRLRIGIVIPSIVPFHTELRKGLKEGMSTVRLDVYDDYAVTNRAVERLSEFVPSLRRTLAWRPDYLVMCSPSVPLVSSEQVMTLLIDFVRRGGGIVFIDNEPTEDVRTSLGRRIGMVTSDVANGARIIANFVGREMDDEDEVLILCGPPSSEPAALRRRVLAEVLTDAQIEVADSGGWTQASAFEGTTRSFRSGRRPRFVVCGNDFMALGAVRALRALRAELGADVVERCEVIGYDGIARVLFAIAEPTNPLTATISTPPSAYGHEIAAMILEDAGRMVGRGRLIHCVIPVSDGQLITRYNVELVLDD